MWSRMALPQLINPAAFPHKQRVAHSCATFQMASELPNTLPLISGGTGGLACRSEMQLAAKVRFSGEAGDRLG
jgi:hypothetical protein